jgi:hypothetical protein
MQGVDLLAILRQTFPTVSAYSTVASVLQANAEGHKLGLQHHKSPYPDRGDSEGNGQGVCHTDAIHHDEETEQECVDDEIIVAPKEVFIKMVQASNYAHKSWTDCRRTLLYMRTEVRFFNEILPMLQSSSGFQPAATPYIFRATCHLEGLVDEEEIPMEPSRRTQADIDDNALLKSSSSSSSLFRGGYIVMERISDQRYHQESPLSQSQAKACLAAVAHFHAAAWEDSKLLQQANDRLSRGSYHLDTRHPQELMGMTDAWQHFSHQFRLYDPELLARTTNASRTWHGIYPTKYHRGLGIPMPLWHMGTSRP